MKEKLTEIGVKHWFTLGMIVVATLAYFFPSIGAHYVIKKILTKVAVGIIFFLGGMKLKFNELKKGLPHWKMHLTIQSFTFILFPCLTIGCVKIAQAITKNDPTYEPIFIGVIILGCVPCASTSSVIWTKASTGNWIVAAFNAVFANLVGIGITPLLLYLFLSEKPTSSPIITARDLALMVVAPMVVGKILALILENKASDCFEKFGRVKWGEIEKILLLFIIWSSFSDSFLKLQSQDLNVFVIITLVGYLIGLYFFMLGLSFLLSLIKYIARDRSDSLVLLFLCPSKTLVLGIPMILILYDGAEFIGLYQIPLLIYQPLQLTVAGILLSPLKAWKERDPKLLLESTMNVDNESIPLRRNLSLR